LERSCITLPPQTPLNPAKPGDYTETMEVAQGKLAMGFVTPIAIRDEDFAAMQVCNAIFGGGMTNLLFMNIREKLSLCYDIGSAYHGSKGLVTVSAGIDPDKFDLVKAQVLTQLEALSSENFTEEIFQAAKQGLLSSLSGIHDSPGGIENYYASGALSGQKMTPEQYADAVRSVTRQQVAACAQKLSLHTTYFLKGVQ
jgi:predicted Zn-dependent peptidase